MPFSTLSSTLRTFIDIFDEIGRRQRSGTEGATELTDFDSLRTLARAIVDHTSLDALDDVATGVGHAVDELAALLHDRPPHADPVRSLLWRQTIILLRAIALALNEERKNPSSTGTTTEALSPAVADAIAGRFTSDSVDLVRFTFNATLHDIAAP